MSRRPQAFLACQAETDPPDPEDPQAPQAFPGRTDRRGHEARKAIGATPAPQDRRATGATPAQTELREKQAWLGFRAPWALGGCRGPLDLRGRLAQAGVPDSTTWKAPGRRFGRAHAGPKARRGCLDLRGSRVIRGRTDALGKRVTPAFLACLGGTAWRGLRAPKGSREAPGRREKQGTTAWGNPAPPAPPGPLDS